MASSLPRYMTEPLTDVTQMQDAKNGWLTTEDAEVGDKVLSHYWEDKPPFVGKTARAYPCLLMEVNHGTRKCYIRMLHIGRTAIDPGEQWVPVDWIVPEGCVGGMNVIKSMAARADQPKVSQEQVDDMTNQVMTSYFSGKLGASGAARAAGNSEEDAEGNHSDPALDEKLKALESDPELEAIIEEIRTKGEKAANKYLMDEDLMERISEKLGGIPDSVTGRLRAIEKTMISVHEAAKSGDLALVQEHIASSKQVVNLKDGRGVTALGYAIGANRITIAKTLIDNRANLHVVDGGGNSGLHYAAGYGQQGMVEFLLQKGGNPKIANRSGMTPADAATSNGHTAIADLLLKACA